MTAACPYLLCAPCLAKRDWATDPVVRTQGVINREKCRSSDESRRSMTHRCAQPGCDCAINPFLKLCRGCAEAIGRCQHCQAYLTAAEEAKAAADEGRLRLLDLFIVARKLYGRAATLDLFDRHRAELGSDDVQAVLLMDHDAVENDPAWKRRPIWTKVLGMNVFRLRYCPDCASAPRRAPALAKALLCDHFTTARSPACCPTCAAERNVCEGCGAASE